MKTIAQRIEELLKMGQRVDSLILGCMGTVTNVHDSVIYVQRGRKKGCFGMPEKLNGPKFGVFYNETRKCWELMHRRKYIMTRNQKILAQNPNHGGANLVAGFIPFISK
jgi:hypothetical protein